ncbi:MAG: PQQ-binding-like beta-propeller repeat protein [Chloracidobacterium sp.]|nr:PQQ-binding-like beta-propeller repeat protein [Chloracidobacterium sp.]
MGEFGRQIGTPSAMSWEAPLGHIPKLAVLPKSSEFDEFGSPNLGGSIVTAGGLVFISAAMDDKLRAFDVETGKLIWEGQLPASAQAAPMTYSLKGNQFVVICAGGHGKLDTEKGDHVVAFTL